MNWQEWDDWKNLYSEGVEVGIAMGKKLGLLEAVKLLRSGDVPECQGAADFLQQHYNQTLAAEREKHRGK